MVCAGVYIVCSKVCVVRRGVCYVHECVLCVVRCVSQSGPNWLQDAVSLGDFSESELGVYVLFVTIGCRDSSVG